MERANAVVLQPELFSAKEAAQKLGIGVTTMRSLIMSNEIKSVLIRRRRLIPQKFIDEYVEGLIQG